MRRAEETGPEARVYLFGQVTSSVGSIQDFVIVNRVVECQTKPDWVRRLELGSRNVKCFLICFLSFIGYVWPQEPDPERRLEPRPSQESQTSARDKDHRGQGGKRTNKNQER